MLDLKLKDKIPCSEIRKRTKMIDIIEYTLKQKMMMFSQVFGLCVVHQLVCFKLPQIVLLLSVGTILVCEMVNRLSASPRSGLSCHISLV